MDRPALGPRSEPVVISVGMQKGGVAKTTNALHLAAALAERGRRVLLWDVDENYGATKVLGLGERPSTMDILTGACRAEEAIVLPEDEDSNLPPNLSFIPSSRALQRLERYSQDSDAQRSNCLRIYVETLRQEGAYDYILIDTGPHASATTRSAYLVSDYFILSLTPEKQAIASLPDALRDIKNAQKPGRNERLKILGLVLSCMDRRLALAKHYEKAIANGFLDRDRQPVKFRSTISTAAAIDRAYRVNKLLFQTEPSHRVCHQFRLLADEVENRIEGHRSGTRSGATAGDSMRIHKERLHG